MSESREARIRRIIADHIAAGGYCDRQQAEEIIDEAERLGRARVLCALGSPTPEDVAQIERLLRERREGRQ